MGPQPSVSASYIKGLLANRCKTNASATAGTRRSRTSTKTSASSGGVVKRRFKRRRKRRRRAAPRVTTTSAARVKTVKPKKKTAEIAIQTADYGAGDLDHELPMNVSVGTSNTSSRVKAKKNDTTHKKKVKNEMKRETADKKPAVLDVITLSDDDDVKPVLKKKKQRDDEPSTSRGTGQKVTGRRARTLDSSDEEEPAAPAARTKKPSKPDETWVPPPELTAPPKPLPPVVPDHIVKQLVAERSTAVQNFLFTPPIAAAIAKNLPMKSLNALSQVNPLLRDICRQEKIKKRRQTIDWFLRPLIVAALNGEKMLNESRIFGNLLSDLYCEPDLIIAFCSPRILYDYRVNFDAPRSPHKGEFKFLNEILADLMPKHPGVTGSTKIVHIRTHGVMPPLPVTNNANARKQDPYGCRESPKDLCVLCIPKIDRVNVWREFLSVSDLRKHLRDSGWLENRSQTHFLLPIIKDLEPLSPKLVIIFSRRLANYTNVASSEFPVIVLNTLDEYVGIHATPDADYGLEWLAFGGNVTAFQVCIKGSSSSLERKLQISHLREQFSAQQVMSGRMLLFYFRNVTKFETENTTEQTALLERDIIQIREEFPRVPVFGGGYQNVIGSCFTGDKADPEFAKFSSGLHSAFVCGVVFGNF